MSDYDYMDDDEKGQYHSDYMEAVNDFAKNLNEADRDSVFETMQDLKYRPTSDAEQDAELNYLRSRNIVAGKKQKLGRSGSGAVGSFLKFKQMEDGMSASEVQRWASKNSKSND